MKAGGFDVTRNLREWKFLGSRFKNTQAPSGRDEAPQFATLHFQFLPLKVSTKFPSFGLALGSVILETFSIHPTIKTLQLHTAFLKRKLESIRSFEDGLACRLHNIKKNHVGKWRGLFEEL